MARLAISRPASSQRLTTRVSVSSSIVSRSHAGVDSRVIAISHFVSGDLADCSTPATSPVTHAVRLLSLNIRSSLTRCCIDRSRHSETETSHYPVLCIKLWAVSISSVIAAR